MGEREVLKASLKFFEIDEEVEALEGESTGDKLLNFILIKKYNMENYKRYGIVKEFLERTNLDKRVTRRFKLNKKLEPNTLAKIAIGSNLNFDDAVYLYFKYGYSLCEFKNEKYRNIILKLNDEEFRNKHYEERLFECGLYDD